MQVEFSPTFGNLGAALAKAQMEIKGAKKASANDFFGSDYADLSSIWEACHEHLNKNEIAVVQLTQPGEPVPMKWSTKKKDGSAVDTESIMTPPVIVTMLVHSSGEWMRGYLSVLPLEATPQALGSAITYGRKYALAAIAGVCPIDDDAEGAMDRSKPAKARLAPPAPIQTGPAVGTIKPKTPITNDKKSRIVTLMKANGIDPTENTAEAWNAAVQKSFSLDLVESNYDQIISALEKTA